MIFVKGATLSVWAVMEDMLPSDSTIVYIFIYPGITVRCWSKTKFYTFFPRNIMSTFLSKQILLSFLSPGKSYLKLSFLPS